MAQLIAKGRIALANDSITAGLVVADTETRDAIRGAVSPLVGEALADPVTSGIVTTAAGIAVNNKLANADIVQGGDNRLLANPEAAVFEVENLDGGKPFRVDPVDTVWVGPLPFVPDDTGLIEYESLNGGKLLKIDPVPGEVTIPRLVGVESINGIPVGLSAITRIVALFVRAQSNELRAIQIDPRLDFPDPRMVMWDWDRQDIATATVPLSSPIPASGQRANGLSPVTQMARRILQHEASGTLVAIVQSAVGDSGLVAEPTNGNWSYAYSGSAPKLYAQAEIAEDAALARLVALYPNATIEKVLVYGPQGEADQNIDPALYQSTFDTMAAQWRAHHGASDLPLVVGGMVLENTNNPANNPPTSGVPAGTGLKAIRAVHVDTPRRLLRTAYAEGPPNGGGSQNLSDLVHGHRLWAEGVGDGLYLARKYAYFNTAQWVPTPPQTVTGFRVNTTLTVTWSRPIGHVNTYNPFYRAVGSTTWIPIPHATHEMTTSVTVVAGSAYEVCVSTTNDIGTSAKSTPVTAFGA